MEGFGMKMLFVLRTSWNFNKLDVKHVFWKKHHKLSNLVNIFNLKGNVSITMMLFVLLNLILRF